MPEKDMQKCMVIFQPSGRRGLVTKGKTIKEASVTLGVDIEGICGEKAICGKCKVRIEEGVFEKYGIESHRGNLTDMGLTERKFFNLREEEKGYRLACQAKILGDIVVFVPEESRMGKQIVRKAAREMKIDVNPAVRKYYVELPRATLDDTLGDWERLQQALEINHRLTNLKIDYQVMLTLQTIVRQGEWKVTVSVWLGTEVIKVEPGRVDKGYGLAVDVGTTTVAGYLCDLTTGKLVATASLMNPQVIYGEDVMSRICYTMTNPEGLKILNQAIIDGLNGLIDDVCSIVNITRQEILDMTIVGNTCMHHIFLNFDPLYIGKAPFPPALHHSLNIKARDWGLKIPLETGEKIKGNNPPCQVACPAHVNGQDFLYLTAQTRYREALELVRRAIPFPGILGRVCTHPCETKCERGNVDDPLSIRNLHRFLADLEKQRGREKANPVEKTKEARVAVIGSGPAGLACAYDLVRRGYPVTVFEAAPKAGGMLRYGIPAYRLPREVLEDEIKYIEEIGVEIKTSSAVGNISAILNQGYKSVFVATGAWADPQTNIAKLNTTGVFHALKFLEEINSGRKLAVGKRLAVIGGGNAAVDAARSAVRLGAKEVTIIYRRSHEEMPAIRSEIEEAEKEGIRFQFLTAPLNALGNGHLTGLRCIRMELGEPDESGRRRPMPIKGSEFDIEIDNVILAIGQSVDKSALKELEYNENGYIKVDPTTLATNLPGVFAGGDAVSGPADVISAVCAGQEAATSIELFLEGIDLLKGRPKPPLPVENVPKEGIDKETRKPVNVLPTNQREGFAEIEKSFEEAMAITECKRCLNCGVYAEKGSEQLEESRGIGIKIAPGAYVHVLPIEAGFVGADNVGVLIAEEPYKQESMELIIDIGTNGELILGNRQRLISSSCATGPAFEGAEIRYGMRAAPGAIEKIVIDRDSKEVRFKVIGRDGWNTEDKDIGAKGMCGSAIIDVVPQLFLAGIIDKTGRFKTDVASPRFRVVDNVAEFVIAWAHETSIGQDVVICQDDIRAIQLAKAAMYAGAKIMMRNLGIEKLDKVILAGAFGSYIDKNSAALLGLFPDCDMNNVYAVGNAAGDGARWALLDVNKRAEADVMARRVEYTELTLAQDFDRVFAQAMWLPHMKDKFPHLEHLMLGKETP